MTLGSRAVASAHSRPATVMVTKKIAKLVAMKGTRKRPKLKMMAAMKKKVEEVRL